MLTGKTNEEKIWNYLTAAGMTACGAAGLMGNLYAESGLIPTNLQNTYEKKLGYTDAAYTAAVDSGAYDNFAKDSAGYGLAQWTYHTRKAALLAFAKAAGKSIGDLEMQLAFLMDELARSFPTVLNTLKSTASVRTASDIVLLKFERPANQGAAVKQKRAQYGQTYYDKYATGQKPEKGSGNMGYSNSQLVSCTRISPNRNSPRNHAIDRISIHCVVGQCTVERIGEIFAPASRKASSNYGVGLDGRVGLYVEERDRSWCTSSAANDNRAVTIEVASDTAHPYAVTAKAYAALLDLCTDICQRNGKKKLLWFGNKDKALAYVPKADEMVLTVHRWFANKACPGEYLYSRHGEIAAEVTRRLADSPEIAAVDKLARLGVLNSPDYWKQAVKSGAVKYLDTLLVKAAEKITKAGPRSSTPENGIGSLVSAGVINTPEYWAEHYRDYPSLGALLCALGGAVK